ncbi:MAG TPA: two-component regulator propeller domain-containing protein, partial [bacterium]|nr:two-component regulator propeller domain-containing protein [bacterium]
MNRFDRARKKFKHMISDPENQRTISHNSITAIMEDRHGNIWVGTKNGLNVIPYDSMRTETTMRFVRYFSSSQVVNSISHSWITAITDDENGDIWIGTQQGLNKITNGEIIRYFADKQGGSGLPSNNITALFKDANNNIWIGTEDGGLCKLDRKNTQNPVFEKIPVHSGTDASTTHADIVTVMVDRQNIVWVGTRLGLDRIDFNSNTKLFFRHNPNDVSSLSDNEIRALCEDRSGNLWIGTYGGGGLNKLDLKPVKFNHIRHKPDNPNSLINNIVRSFWEDSDGILWIGTHDGLNRYDAGTDRFTAYRAGPGRLSSNEVRTIAEDKNGMIWLGTEGGGLNKFDRRTNRFTVYQHRPGDSLSIAGNDISVLLSDKYNQLWIGTFGDGLDKLIVENGKEIFVHYRNVLHRSQSLSHNEVSSILMDSEEKIWVGTFGGGLNRLDSVQDRTGYASFKRIAGRGESNSSLGSDVIFAISEDSDKNIWIGASSGLNRIVRTTDGSLKFYNYYEKDGLPDNYVYAILPDEHGNLWISTVQGLSRARLIQDENDQSEKLMFRNFDESDGLQNNEFKYGSYYKSRSGEIFFGGTNGFNRFYPKLAMDNPHIPQIVLTAFKTMHKSDKAFVDAYIESVYRHDPIILDYNEDFSFEFASLDFTEPAKNQYAYKLEGFDKNWILAGTRRYVNYTNLDAGNYVFNVRGSNNDGVWNEQGISIPIRIVPPFWKTWWFIALSFSALMGLLWAFIRYRVRVIELQKNKLEVEVSNRTREIKAQRDDLKTINSQLEKTLQELNETQSQLMHAEKMASLGQMVAGIAHEINNPLTVVDGNLHLLEENVLRWDHIITEYERLIETADPEKIKMGMMEIRERHEYEYVRQETMKILDSCKNGSQRIKHIVQDLRKFSRTDAMGFIPADLHEGIESTLTVLKSMLSDRITVHKQFGTIPMLDCYPGLLNQVFLNILTNAIEAIPNEGIITI